MPKLLSQRPQIRVSQTIRSPAIINKNLSLFKQANLPVSKTIKEELQVKVSQTREQPKAKIGMRKIQWFHPQSHNQRQLRPTNNLSLPHLILNHQNHPLLIVDMEVQVQVVDILRQVQVTAIQPPVQVEELAPQVQAVEEAAAL
jgi:hypothetical protein